jgi:hypothetical protein
MSFSTDMTGPVADQLSRFVTLNRHQLAGQAANLDFWLAQVRHTLAVIGGYGARFAGMRGAQEQHAATRGTTEFAPGAGFPTEQKAWPPRRLPDHELRRARRGLTEATTRFSDCCRREGLISESQFPEACGGLGLE